MLQPDCACTSNTKQIEGNTLLHLKQIMKLEHAVVQGQQACITQDMYNVLYNNGASIAIVKIELRGELTMLSVRPAAAVLCWAVMLILRWHDNSIVSHVQLMALAECFYNACLGQQRCQKTKTALSYRYANAQYFIAASCRLWL